MIPPLAVRYEGDGVFVASHKVVADRHFCVHERYVLVQHQERSAASHAHFFAALAEAWANLPEREAERFPTPESLRKWCLIKAGYADSRSIVAASKAEAQRVAAFIKPMDTFAVVTVDGPVVTVYTAQSQSMRAMGRKAFQDSKDKCLAIAADLVGVAPDVLEQRAVAA